MSQPFELMWQEARTRWGKEQFEAALTSYRAAVAAAPDNIRLALEAAKFLGMRYEVAEAEDLLRCSAAQLINDPNGLFAIGQAYELASRPDAAFGYFQQVTRLQPAHSAAWLRIAKWYERRHRLDEAWDAVERGMAGGGLRAEARFMRARLLRRLGHTTNAEAELFALSRDTTAPSRPRVDAWYELADLYDRQHDARRAFDAATQAKRLIEPQIQRFLDQGERLARIQASFVDSVLRQDLERWQADPPHDPTALFTGPPRSGTSLVERVLGAHPLIASADETQVYSFAQTQMLFQVPGQSASEVLGAVDPARVMKTRGDYRRWMAAALGIELDGKLVFDKSPSFTSLIPGFRRLFPRAAILMALRDPRDVIVSCYLCNLPLNPVTARFQRLDWTAERCCREWSAWVTLREKLPDPWAEVRYENLVADLPGEAKRLVAKLGLEWSDDLLEYRSTLQDRPVRSPTYEQLTGPVHQKAVGRWKPYEPYLGPLMKQIEPVLDALGYS